MKFKHLLILPFLLVVKLLKPIVLIRFGVLKSSHLGFFASETTNYLLEKEQDEIGSKALDLFSFENASANDQLTKMWLRKLKIFPGAEAVAEVARKSPFFSQHLIPLREEQFYDVGGLIAQTPCVLEFTQSELQNGAQALVGMGIPPEAKFVCLSVRDSKYDEAKLGREAVDHNRYRDADIRDYLSAVNFLLDNGYYVLRMGAVVAEALDIEHERFIDYASTHRTPFLDVFLCAHCSIFFCDSGGLVNLARVFKRPIAMSNWIPIGLVNTAQPQDLIIHKRLASKGKLLTLEEQFGTEINSLTTTADYDEAELDILNNSPEEILELVQEMHARICGDWQDEQDADTLQQKYWSLFADGQIREPIRARIGADFLRKALTS